MKKFGCFILLAFAFLFVPSGFYAQTASLEATLSLQNIDGGYVPFQNGIPVPSFEKQNRYMLNLKGQWKKLRFSANHTYTLAQRDVSGYNNIVTESQNRYQSNYDDSSWPVKNIPGVENTMNTYPNVPENYENGVWYRYKFTANDSLKGQFVKLIFQSVNYVADVWLNDSYLGYHEGGYTPFALDVTGKINFSGQNVLAVRVDNPAWGSRHDIVPFYTCDWFNYTGIIGDVYLEASSTSSIVRADILPLDVNGNIKTQVAIFNRGTTDKTLTASISIYNTEINSTNIQSEKASDLIGSTATFTGTSEITLTIAKDSVKLWNTNLLVQNPKLWSTKTPNLYVMKVTIKDNGSTIDEFFTQFGIRTVTSNDTKVLLNNNPVFFTGTARHEDHPVYGRSIPRNIIYSDLQKVKEVNANMLRTAHYPNNPYTYLIADRLGIAIIEEIPVWWFDDPNDWFIQNYQRQIHLQMFKEMVFKDFNRPSILFWSTSNECKDVNGRSDFEFMLKQEMNSSYPNGRLITQSAAADRPGSYDQSQKNCDAAGWTMYFGIFHGSTYYDGTKNFLTNANLNNPGKPILDTEFGYWSGEGNTNSSTQVTVFNETFKAFKEAAAINPNGTYNSTGYLAGVTWWCIFDWYTYQQISRNGYQSMGLYTMDRTTAKTVAGTLKAAYAPYFSMGGFVTTGVEKEKENEIPLRFSLEQNYPNPFNPETKIKYSVARQTNVKLSVYNVLGKEIAVLVNEMKSPGVYTADFSGLNLPSGVYLYKIEAGSYTQMRKMMLVK